MYIHITLSNGNVKNEKQCEMLCFYFNLLETTKCFKYCVRQFSTILSNSFISLNIRNNY